MYKAETFYNAGTNEIHRYGHKAQEKLVAYLEPNEKGFYSIPADGGKYWTIGTSEGKYGEFAKFHDTFLSVNSMGRVWAKVGTPKADAFVAMINNMINVMKETNQARIDHLNEITGVEDEDDEEEDED